MTRLDEIIAAVSQQLRRCAADVDQKDNNIRSVTISVKLVPGTARPRAVICEVESETRFLLPAGRS